MDSRKRNVLDKLEGAEDILDLINKVKEAVAEPPAQIAEEKKETKVPAIRLFSFLSMDSVIHASHLLQTMYFGSNTLYKDTSTNTFILVLTQSEHTTADTIRYVICYPNMALWNELLELHLRIRRTL